MLHAADMDSRRLYFTAIWMHKIMRMGQPLYLKKMFRLYYSQIWRGRVPRSAHLTWNDFEQFQEWFVKMSIHLEYMCSNKQCFEIFLLIRNGCFKIEKDLEKDRNLHERKNLHSITNILILPNLHYKKLHLLYYFVQYLEKKKTF